MRYVNLLSFKNIIINLLRKHHNFNNNNGFVHCDIFRPLSVEEGREVIINMHGTTPSIYVAVFVEFYSHKWVLMAYNIIQICLVEIIYDERDR